MHSSIPGQPEPARKTKAAPIRRRRIGQAHFIKIAAKGYCCVTVRPLTCWTMTGAEMRIEGGSSKAILTPCARAALWAQEAPWGARFAPRAAHRREKSRTSSRLYPQPGGFEEGSPCRFCCSPQAERRLRQ